MTSNVFWAWLHYLSVLIMFGMLLVEHLLFRPGLDTATAKRLGIVDAIYGASATLVLITGVLRMSYEKGFAFYVQHWAFHALITVFVIVGLLSIYPTVMFLRWRKQAGTGQAPVIPGETAQRIILILRTELALVLLLPLFATWMARGA